MNTTAFTKRRKVLVFIDADIVVRAFIAGGAFIEIEKNCDVEYVYAVDPSRDRSSINVDLADYGLNNARACSIPRKRMGYWYFLFAAHALHVNRGTRNYSTFRDHKFLRELGVRNTLIVEFFSRAWIYPVFRFLLRKFMGSSHNLAELLDEVGPDILIYPTLLTGWFLNDLIPMADKRGVPLVLCMNSWDNPSSKAVCTGTPTRLVVWGEQSKQESVRYLGLPENIIECFGAAQFQLYRTPPSQSRAELCAEFGVPEDKKIILYAGTGESINETEYLKRLEQAVATGVLPDCHILYRPHPWRGRLQKGETDFFALNWNHVSMDPHMVEYYQREIQNPSRKLLMADYQVTNRLLKLCEAVVSARSTLLLEALVNGRPILVLFPDEIDGQLFSSQYVHFRSLVAAPEVNSCFKLAAIDDALRNMYEQMLTPGIETQLKGAAEHFAVMTGESYSIRLSNLVDELVPLETLRTPDPAIT
jgi:hypothetical protein